MKGSWGGHPNDATFLLCLSLLSSTQGPQEAADLALGQQDDFLTGDQASACFFLCLPKWATSLPLPLETAEGCQIGAPPAP